MALIAKIATIKRNSYISVTLKISAVGKIRNKLF